MCKILTWMHSDVKLIKCMFQLLNKTFQFSATLKCLSIKNLASVKIKAKTMMYLLWKNLASKKLWVQIFPLFTSYEGIWSRSN